MFRDLPFKAGIVIYGSYPDSLDSPDTLRDRLVQVASDPFFEAVELPIVEDEGLWEPIRAIIEEAGMDVVAAAGPSFIRYGWNLSSTDPVERREAIEGMKRGIDYAYAIGARQLIFLSGRDPGEAGRDEARAALLDAIDTLASYAGRNATAYVLTLSLEPADREVMYRQLIGPTAEAAELARRARPGTFGITLDMSHVPQLGETLEGATETLGPLVTHAHIANALLSDPSHPAYGDRHPRFGLPGSEFDVPDIARFLRVLFERCFRRDAIYPYDRPVISLEVRPGTGMDPAIGLAGAKRALVKACREVWADER